MEEKKVMTTQELEEAMNHARTMDMVSGVLIYAGIGLAFVMLFMKQWLMMVAGIVLLYIGGSIEARYGKKAKTMLTENVTKGVLSSVFGDEYEYNPWGTINPGNMMFPFDYNNQQGSDHIRAVYHGVNVELGDIELLMVVEDEDENGNKMTSAETRFKGQWLICDSGKESAGNVFVSEYSKKDRKKMKGNVTMDNAQFNSRFCVKADNPQDAFYILTPHMMEYITEMADKGGGTVYVSFLHDGKVNVAIHTKKNLFEFGKSSVDIRKLTDQFTSELKWYTDLIDALRVGERV